MSEPVESDLLIKMRDAMTHRGPDDAGFYISPNKKIGLAHRRLSIVDLSADAHQPMSNEAGTIWIVFNGEIYNHLALRRDLETRHRYRSASDTETIIHLYEEKGPACVDYLDGMFSLAIWDEVKQELFLARDRIGKKPLYYHLSGGAFIFASEIKAILADSRVPRAVNEEALWHYLTFLVTPPPLTMFGGVNKLKAGHCMTIDGHGVLKEWKYWDPIVPSTSFTEEYYIEELRKILMQSVKKRLMADVPVGVFLSGGLDSSMNVALMSSLMKRPVSTYSVAFHNRPEYDEFPYARRVAKLFGTDHHEKIISEKEVLDYLPQMVHSQDEPIADWVCVPLYFVSKLAHDCGTKVVQLGEGSDEQFIGYSHYMKYLSAWEKYWQYYARTPKMMRQAIYEIARNFPGASSYSSHVDLLRRAAYDEGLFWGGAIGFWETQKALLADERLKNRYNSATVVGPYLNNLRLQKPLADFSEQMQYLEFKLRLPELLLMRVDKIAMSVSVEGRAPYLDTALVEFVTGIPSALKTKNGETKYLLKKAAERFLPRDIIYRKKQGFSAPIPEWFNGRLGGLMEDTIMNSKIKQSGYLNYEYVRELIKQQRSGKKDVGPRLWILFNLCAWFDQWVA